MTYHVVLQPGAENDIDEAYQWYEAQRIGLGDQFLRELVEYYQKLQQNPAIFKSVSKQYRQAALRKFPFVIIYKIAHTEVQIYAVFHTSRNPKEKFSKR